jgi:hypothetical protein
VQGVGNQDAINGIAMQIGRRCQTPYTRGKVDNLSAQRGGDRIEIRSRRKSSAMMQIGIFPCGHRTDKQVRTRGQQGIASRLAQPIV